MCCCYGLLSRVSGGLKEMSGLLDVVSMYRQFVRVGVNQIVTYLSRFTFEITFSGICENATLS